VEAASLVDRLEKEKEVSIRRSLILALGEYTAEQVTDELRRRVVELLLPWYRDDPDAGIHGAIDWLLRHAWEGPDRRRLDWGQARALAQIDRELRRRDPDGKRGWYVNGQGQTMATVDSREPFLMSSPGNERGRYTGNENLHWRQIGRRYALATKPVTVLQWQRFLKANPEVKHFLQRESSPDLEGPIISVTWYQAAQYCRWLSEQEGVPEEEMVYPPVAEIEKSKNGVTPLRMPANYLKRTGYRLPTEAEWEFACRAGARTSYYYGSSVELLPRYGWFLGNAGYRTWPVGQKKPNDLGLFDRHGNAYTWCQDSYGGTYRSASRAYPAPDQEDMTSIASSQSRVLRGGSFLSTARDLRASGRTFYVPTSVYLSLGVCVARTCR
jgi:formylglycine-generating enzyme required for sulfatase activity